MENSKDDDTCQQMIIDLRSDTVSKPSKAMWDAIYHAKVGDDVYVEDPSVNELEKRASLLIGKEAALFVTSGTMGNLIAIMNLCDIRGAEVIAGADSHIALHEQGGAAQIAGVTLSTIPNNPDGTFDLRVIEAKLQRKSELLRLHEPILKMIAVENTFNGKVVPMSFLNELTSLVRGKDKDVKLHLDGARLFNAAIASETPVRDIARHFDSVTFCLSKGLGAPVGSLLCGTRDFIDRARRARKVLGGGMRQAGVLAAAGLVALDEIVPLLERDHKRTYKIASAINDLGSSIFSVDMSSCQTNMIFVDIQPTRKVDGNVFVKRLQTVDEPRNPVDRIMVKAMSLSKYAARMVLYHEIDDQLTEDAIKKITLVIRELDPTLQDD